MSDNEIEDIQFLPGSSAGKRGVYEPHGLQKCKQFICSPLAAAAIVASVLAVIFCVALIAALARPPAQCTTSETTAPLVSVPPTSPEDQSFPWADLRLPRAVSPQLYDLFLHPNLTSFTFSGTVSITIQVSTSTTFIVFHSKNLTLVSTRLYDAQQTELDVSAPLVSASRQQVYLETSDTLQPGNTYRLVIEFSGLLQDNLAGFYRSVYTTKSGQQRWIATTQFEATDARAAFPCFDEPNLKARFKLSIVRDTDHITVSNTPIIKQEPLDTDPKLMVDYYNTSLRMSTYLVAFVVCDFAVVKANTSDGRPVNIYVPPEYTEEATLASKVAPDILEYYEEFYGVKYPLEKSDHIAIPDFSAGAMENWGLITYRLMSLLVDTSSASPQDQEWVVMVIAHELAHQWFGNLVTMQWWNDLWLNEGFASYIEYKGTDSVRPEWDMFDRFLTMTMWEAMAQDGLKSSHPISTEVKDPAQIEELFDSISYSKGAAIIRMLESFLGSDNFQQGLQRYLKKYQYNNARTVDLWAALSEKAAKDFDVAAVMQTWTEQMGYPVVSITRDGDTLTISQERFLFNPRSQTEENFDSPYGYKWHIPLSYTTDTTAGEGRTPEWMTPDTDTLKINLAAGSKWVKFNLDHTGVYRVNYSPEMYKSLIEQLKSDHTVFSAADRASLIEDVFALSRSGHVPISQALDLSRYLEKETEYVPWETAIRGFTYMSHLMVDKSTYSSLEKYCLSLMSSLLEQNPWDEVQGQMNKYRQEMILANALHLQHTDTIKTALDMFRQWMNGSELKPSLKSLVYATGAKYGDTADWDYLYSRYKVASDLEQKEFLHALPLTTDGIKLQRLLDLSLNTKEVRSQDATSLIVSVAANPAGQVLAWNFVKKNWDMLYSRYSVTQFQMKHIIKVPRQLATQYDYNDVKEFFEKNLPGRDHLTVNQTLENIEMNIDWLSRNRGDLEMWLKNLDADV